MRQARLILAFIAALCALHAAGLAACAASVWDITRSGNWSDAANWANGAPVSDAATVLEFGGTNGGAAYAANNDVANPFVLDRLIFAGAPDATNHIAGLPLQFANAGGGIRQSGSGAFVVSNGVALAADAEFGGAGTGQVTLAGSIAGTGLVTKRGPWTLVWQASNTIGGSILVDDADSVLRVEHPAGLGSSSLVVSNGTLAVNIGSMAHTFGGGAYRSALVTGPNSVWTNGSSRTFIGTNATLTVTGGACLYAGNTNAFPSGIATKGGGSVPVCLYVGNGAKVYATVQAGSPARPSAVVGEGSAGDTAVIAGANTLWDGGSSSTRSFNIGNGVGGNSNRLVVTDGAVVTNVLLSIGQAYNGLVASNGATILCSLYCSGNNNWTRLTGSNTLLKGAIRWGQNGANSGNELTVADGAAITGDVTVCIQGNGQFDNRVVVTNGGRVFGTFNLCERTSSNIHADSCSNNSIRVTGRNSYWGLNASATVGGNHRSQTVSNRWNKLIIDDGAVMTNTAAAVGITVGMGSACVGNGVVVSNGGQLCLGTAGLTLASGTNTWLNYVQVTGTGSQVRTTGPIRIGTAPDASFNQLTVAEGGVLQSSAMITIGSGTDASNNSVTVNGGILNAAGIVFSNALPNGLTLSGAAQVTITNLMATNANNLVVLDGGTLNVKNAAVGNGTPFVVGDGIQTAALYGLGGTNTFADGLSVSRNATLGGIGVVQAATTVAGGLRPGRHAAALTHVGALTLSAGAQTTFDIATNTAPGAGWSLLCVTNGALTLGGRLRVVLAPDYVPSMDSAFLVITNAQPLSGTFESPLALAYTDLQKAPVGVFRITVGPQSVTLHSFWAELRPGMVFTAW
jgi:hypothetical protein